MIRRFLIIIFSAIGLYAQPDLSGVSICLDPGHGGPDDKPFEGWINHQVAPFAEEFLLRANPDTVILTKRDSTTTMSLSQREYIANSNNVDYFHSIHHNAFNGQSNYTLALYEQLGSGGPPQWPGQADVMADTVSHWIWKALRTSYDAGGHGDMDFLGFNLGVLNDLNMPGDLSEGSFWDYPAEIHRLRNAEYLRTEGEAISWAFFRYFDTQFPLTASLTGIITNSLNGKPANGVTCMLLPDSLVYTTDNKQNGFYRFEDLNPGMYTLRATSELDTVEAVVSVYQGRFNHADISIEAPLPPEPPGQVELQWCVGQDSTAYIKWRQAAGTVTGYHLYFANSPDNFQPENYITVFGTDTFFSPPNQKSIFYFKVKAFNDYGESGNPSDTYGCTIGEAPYKALIVDGFDRYTGSASWKKPYHDFAAEHGLHVTAAEAGFDCIENSSVTSYNLLLNYDAVIWILGDESTQDETFSTGEQNIVKTFLQNGGRLFVSGSEIAWDLDHSGTSADQSFIHNFLGCKYIADDAEIYSVSGDQGSFAEGLNFTYGGANSPYPEDYPDVLSTSGGSFTFAHYSGGTKIAGTYLQGTVPGGSQEARVVVLGFPFETIDQTNVKTTLMQRILGFLNPDLAVDDNFTFLQPEQFRLGTPYPNPFNGELTIPITVTRSAGIELHIYDLSGRLVRELIRSNLSPGKHYIHWDARDDNGLSMSSGIYFVKMSFNQPGDIPISQVKRITLIK